jgi:two-component system chemotaxis sensor kinase CheA
MAAMFGAGAIGTLSHSLETAMDGLRLGKIELTREVLDLLFETVDVFQRQLASFTDPDAPEIDAGPIVDRIDALSAMPAAEVDESALDWLDESIVSVLTEYEEHRLRENLRASRRLYRIHASFDLLAIDVGIEDLKRKMKTFGEVITYLPSADGSAEDRIDLDILLGTRASLSEVAAGVTEEGVTVEELTAPSPEPKKPPAPVQIDEPSPMPAPVSEPRAGAEPGPAAVEREAPDVEISLRSLSQTVRVDLHRLDHLMNLVGELGLVQANLGEVLDHLRGRGGDSDLVRELQTQVRTMSRKLSMLQEGILDVRMVPLGQVFDKLARVVRKLGRDSGKEIRLTVSGADTELDKLIVEELSDPLMHMVRNCIDHGIESEAERVEAGKPAVGHVDLRAFQKGNRVVIEVEDDGRGIDWRQIRDIALKQRVLSDEEAEEMTKADAMNLLFAPGFTTRPTATQLSGRGVGMDVVKTNIARLSGMIDIDTEPGRGTKVSVTLPVTLAIIQALVIESAGEIFCVPLNSVLESIMVQRTEIQTVEGHDVISLRGATLPLLKLSRLFGLSSGPEYRDPTRIYVVIVGLAQQRVGLVVDELLGQHDVVIKPLATALRKIPGIAGATELGANRTVLLLDVATLVEETMIRAETSLAASPTAGGGPLGGP